MAAAHRSASAVQRLKFASFPCLSLESAGQSHTSADMPPAAVMAYWLPGLLLARLSSAPAAAFCTACQLLLVSCTDTEMRGGRRGCVKVPSASWTPPEIRHRDCGQDRAHFRPTEKKEWQGDGDQ